MLHRILTGLLLAIALPVPALATPPGPIRHMEGRAFDHDGHLLYRESHWQFDAPDGPTGLVLYRCPDGAPFARKWVRDHGQPQAPDFDLYDARQGYREGVRRRADGRREVYVQRDAHAAEHAALLKEKPLPVIDAGFDAFLRGHWDSLAPQASLTVPFLLPSRLGTLDFKVTRIADAVVDGQPARRFRLGLAGLIGFALPHLDVAYAAASRTLLRFEGIANIRDVDGRNLHVRIEFPPQEAGPASAAGLAAAEHEALSGRCPLR